MLRTATIVISLGADSTNVRHASAERVETADISFATSFNDNSAVVGEIQPQIGDPNIKDAVDGENCILVTSRGAIVAVADMKPDVGVEDELRNKSIRMKSLPPPANNKATLSVSREMTIPATGGIVRIAGKTNEDYSLTTPEQMPKSQISLGNVKVDDQRFAEAGGSTKPDAADGTADFCVGGVASVISAISGSGIKQTILDSKEKLTLDKNRGAVSTEEEAKDHGGIVKAERSAKAEEKNSIQGSENTVTVGAKTVLAVPVVVLSTDGEQDRSNAGREDDALSSVTSLASGRSVGMTTVKTCKPDKNAVATKQADVDGMRTAGSVVADDASVKAGAYESKPSPSTVNVTDSENTKPPNPMETVVSNLVHAERMATGANSGRIVGDAAAVRPQTAEYKIHAAVAQADSSGIDSGVQIEATHKTLIATATSLEIGVVNGTHGWLKIRAEMTDRGVVNASLSTVTSSGQEMLHRELPSLTAYLHSEQVVVNTVVVQQSMPPAADFQGFEGVMNRDGRGLAHQGQGGENQQGAASSDPNRIEKEGFYRGVNGVGGDELLPLASHANGGNWLNVRA